MTHDIWPKVELLLLWLLNYTSQPSNILLWLTIAYTGLRIWAVVRELKRARVIGD